MDNTSFSGFSAGPHCQVHPAAVGRILDFSGLAAIFARLAHTVLCNMACFAGKVQATPHANLDILHLSIAAEWDRLAVGYICRTCS
jgi:hypothetical protein